MTVEILPVPGMGEVQPGDDLAELIVAKHRNGATGTVELVFLGESTSFRNYVQDRGDAAPTPF